MSLEQLQSPRQMQQTVFMAFAVTPGKSGKAHIEQLTVEMTFSSMEGSAGEGRLSGVRKVKGATGTALPVSLAFLSLSARVYWSKLSSIRIQDCRASQSLISAQLLWLQRAPYEELQYDRIGAFAKVALS